MKLIYMYTTIDFFKARGIELVIPATQLVTNKEGYHLITDV